MNGQSIGKHTLVKQAVQAVFRLRPPLPKYKITYDMSPVLDYISKLSMSDLKSLTYKTLMLLVYATISRLITL